MTLNRFKVPDEIAVRVQPGDMQALVENIFQTLGMPQQDARQCAEVLIYADVRGIDSHGVSYVMQVYVDWLESGELNPSPKPKVVAEAPATVTIDGDRGLALTVGPQVMQRAMDKAQSCGIGAAVVRNSYHLGACAYHAAMALDRDMIGVVMTIGSCRTVPTFGSKPMVGNNPIAIAVPTRNQVPFIFDASMSSLPLNKVKMLRRLGAKIMPGWMAEPDGTPIMNERPVADDYTVLPLGGTRQIGSHKGYGLSVAIDILCGILAGGAASYKEAATVCHHFMAYRVDAFTDLDSFKDDMDQFMTALHESPSAPGHEKVYYAGLPEHETAAERRQRGIPYHPDVIEWFKQTADRLGVAHLLG